MGIDEQRAEALLGQVHAYKYGQGGDKSSAQSAYDELRGMGFGPDDVTEGIAALHSIRTRPTATPKPEKGLIDRVTSYFSGDEDQPDLPDGEQQATAKPAALPTPAPAPAPKMRGKPLEPGNIDLTNRPIVQNRDGTSSTVRSMSIEEDGKEVLIPMVAEDPVPRVLSEKEAIDRYRRTGEHLGKFGSIDDANEAGDRIHQEQAGGRVVNGRLRLGEVPAPPSPEQQENNPERPLRRGETELRDTPRGIDVPGLFDKFVAGASAVGGAVKSVFDSALEPNYDRATRGRGAVPDPIGKETAKKFISGMKDSVGGGKDASNVDFAKNLAAAVVSSTPAGPASVLAEGLDKFGSHGPILNPKSKFAEEHPTAFSLVNEVIEQPRQLYVGLAHEGPRETLKTLEQIPEMVTGPAGEGSQFSESVKALRELTLPDAIDKENVPQTFGQRVAQGIGRGLTGDLPIIIALTRALGPVRAMAVYSAMKTKQEDPMSTNADLGVAATKGGMQGQMMELTHPFTRPVQAGIMGGATTADALAQGAPADQALESGVVMGALAAQGPGGKVGLREGVGDSAKRYVWDPVKGGFRGVYDRVQDKLLERQLNREEEQLTSDWMKRWEDPLATDPYKDLYEPREAERLRRRKERAQQRAADLMEERLRSSGSTEPITPDEIDNAVKTADVMESKAGAPAPNLSEGVQQHPGFKGVSEGDPLFDLTKAELHPEEMQYKRTGEGGVTNRLKGITFFSPKAAGSPPVILWYNSPNRKDGVVGDGSMWVVDGHHRVERAHAMGANMPVKVEILDGAEYTPAEARTHGALSNIGLGNGTPTDAAKLFREAGMSAEDVAAHGLSTTDEKIIKPALGLAKLNDALFRRVTLGEMPEWLGAELGEILPDHQMQDALLHALGNQKKGKGPSHATIIEMAHDIANSPMGEARRNGQMMLGEDAGFDPKKWGVDKESLYLEKAQLSTRIVDALTEEAKHFRRLSDKELAKRAAEIGSNIDIERAKENAQIAGQIMEVYRRLSRGSGPISDALLEGARRMRAGEKLRDVAKGTYGGIRDAVLSEISGMKRGDELPGNEGAPGATEPPGDTATGDMFGGGKPVAPEPPAPTEPPGASGEPPAPASPAWEEPTGKKGWVSWTKEQRALDDTQLLDAIQKMRPLADAHPGGVKTGPRRALAILDKIREDRGIEDPRRTEPKLVDPAAEDAATGTSDEPADPLAGNTLPPDEFEAHQARANSMSDAELQSTLDELRRAHALGSVEASQILPIYEDVLSYRKDYKTQYGDDAKFGTGEPVSEPKTEPAFESPEAAEKFAAWMDKLGDGELRERAQRWSAMRATTKDPALLARMDALDAELKKRAIDAGGTPPPDDAITPGSVATPEETLRARLRKYSPEALDAGIRRGEAQARRLPLGSKKREKLERATRAMREVLAEKMGVEDPILKGDLQKKAYEAKLREHARKLSMQKLVDLLKSDRLTADQRPFYQQVHDERLKNGEGAPKPSTEKKKRSTAETGGKTKKRKSADPEQLGRLGGVDPEDEPVGPNAYARRDGRIEQEDYGPSGTKAAPGLDPELEIPTDLPDDIPQREAPPEAEDVPVGRVGIRSIFGLRRPTTNAGVDELVRRSDIVRKLAERLKVPIRQGRITMRRALGIYKVRPEVIRARAMKDIMTVAHEIGHHIDKRVFSNQPSGPMEGPFWNRRPANFGTPTSRRMGGLQGRTFDPWAHELHPLATPGNPGSEGFAEFVGMYVVDPAQAAHRAPTFYRYFEQTIRRRAPEVMEALQDARRDVERYRQQPATQKVLSNISIGDYHDKPAGQRGWYHNWMEDIAPLRQYRDMVAGPNQRDRMFREIEWSNLDANEDPYVMTRLLAGWMGKANAFIEKGQKGALDFATLNRVHRPLQEALEGVRDFNDLRTYMYSRRTLEVASRQNGRRVETGISPDLARRNIAEVEARDPNIRRTFDEIRAIQDAALKYLADSGMLTQAEYARIREANRDYVPLYRLMEDDVEAGFQKRRRPASEKEVVDLHNPIYRLKGSTRDIIDPLESMVKNIYTYVYLAERNKVGQSLVELARRTHGSGFGVEEIPPDMVPAVQLSPAEIESIIGKYTRREVSQNIRELVNQFSETTTTVRGANGQPQGGARQAQLIEGRVLEALRARGFSEGESRQMVDRIKSAPAGDRETIIKETLEKVRIVEIKDEMRLALPESLVPIFRPGMNKKGEPIVEVKFEPHAGQPHTVYLRLSPELYQVVKGLDAESAGTVTRVLAPLARGLRAGVVLSPEFAMSNIVRDQMTAFLQSRNGYIPVFDLFRGIGHLMRNTELAKDFYLSGGAMASLTALDRKYLQRSVQQAISESGGQLTGEDMKKMNPLERWRAHMMNTGNRIGVDPRKTFLLTHPIEALRVISEWSDNATRLGEYARGIRNAERAGVTSRREQIARAGYAAREVTIDFARAGAKARQLNKIIAFWNVALQGPDRLLAAAKRDPMGFSVRALIGITLPSALLWAANHGDPRVDDLDDRTKDLHYVIPTGTVSREQWQAMTAEERAEYSAQHPIFIIPKPYEAGLVFGSLVERMLDWSYKNDPKAVQKWIGSSLAALSPGIMPTAVGPVIEAAANYSFFRGAKLVPRGLEDVEAIQQRTGYTSPVAIQIARAMNMVPMPEYLGKSIGLQSPIKIENYIRGYLGGSGRIVSDLADAMIESQGTEVKPELTLADRFGVRRFVRRYPLNQNRAIEDFYDYYQKGLEAKATADLLEKRGDEAGLNKLYADRQMDLATVDMLAAVAKQLSMMRAAADGFRHDDSLNAHQKRIAIDAMAFNMMDLARQAVDSVAEARREDARQQSGQPLEEEPDDPAPPAPKMLPAPAKKPEPYDPPDVTGPLSRGELAPRDLSGFAAYHKKQRMEGVG